MSRFSTTPALQRLARALNAEARRAAKDVTRALEDLAKPSYGLALHVWKDAHERALRDLSQALTRLSSASDLAGRLDMRFGASAPEPEAFAAEVPDIVPSVEFEAAWRDLLERDPFGADELARAGREVADLYSGVPDGRGGVFYPHGFALALAADREVAQRVRDRLAASIALGTPTQETARILAEEWTWPRAYAETVTRTTVNTATTAGRFVEAQRVAAAGIPVGFRFECVMDSNLRQGRPQDNGENHRALHGLVARQDDPIWRRFSPPGGYACRCSLSPVIGDEVPSAFVTVPAGAAFAPGFGTRADLRRYG